MKSVGEAMAIGRTFKEALQKAVRSLEIKRFGLCGDGADRFVDQETLRLKLSTPNAERIFYLAQAFRDGMSVDEVFELTKIDRWFLQNVQQIVAEAQTWRTQAGSLRDRSGTTPELRPRNTGFQPVPSSEHPARNIARSAIFRGFDPYGEVIQRRRNLPHREQPGATYFVTFRLGDSVPLALLLE